MKELPPHGTPRRYDLGCHEACCRAAHAARARAKRRAQAYGRWQGRIPVAGTARRLQALVALGWSFGALSRRGGWGPHLLWLIATKQRSVTPAVAARVAALYDELWDQAPPAGDRHERKAVTRTRRFAAERGWAPPLAWDDDEIDDPDARPHMPTGSSARELRPCGTLAAARRHRRNNEPLCPRCRAAEQRHEDEAA